MLFGQNMRQISLLGCSLMKKKYAQLKIIVQCLTCALKYTRKEFRAYWIKRFCFTDRRIFLYFSVPQAQNLAQKIISVQKVFIYPYFTRVYYFIMIGIIKALIANLVFHLCTTSIQMMNHKIKSLPKISTRKVNAP